MRARRSLRPWPLLAVALVLGCDPDGGEGPAAVSDDDTTPGGASDDDATHDTNGLVPAAVEGAAGLVPADPGPDPQDLARWTFLVFMNGDNNLENLVFHDLNELEMTGSGDGVHVVVEADRIPGYDERDGDWTGARRYYITQDGDLDTVTSEVVEELGEVDMGSPTELSSFLLWAAGHYPAEHYAFMFWNHGGGWNVLGETSEFVSSDDTSGSWLSIAGGDVIDGLQPFVDQHGPIDVVGYDACNMAFWEVAHSMRAQADYMTASQATVGSEGFQYQLALQLLRSRGDATPSELADALARDAHEFSREWTESAVDLAGMDALAAAMDTLALALMVDADHLALAAALKEQARAAEVVFHDWYVDLKDFAAVCAASSDAQVAAAGTGVLTALDAAVVSSYGLHEFDWVGGLSVFMGDFVPDVTLYSEGAGATWSQATHWDDLLRALAGGA